MIFLTKQEVSDLLCNNTKYYRSFREGDMIARKIKSIADYHSIILQDSCDFSDYEKEILRESAKKADEILARINIPGFDGDKASKMRWKIGCMSSSRYEGGYPHTVKSTIILFKDILRGAKSKSKSKSTKTKSKKSKIVQLLIHEKVHIYQRKYKKDMETYLSHHHFVPISSRQNGRANPDLDDMVYYNQKNGKIYESNYRRKRPKSVTDVKNKKYEHPYEEMAYRIEKM